MHGPLNVKFKSKTSQITVELGYNFTTVPFVVVKVCCFNEVYNAMVNSGELTGITGH